jgi:hypothetical protein
MGVNMTYSYSESRREWLTPQFSHRLIRPDPRNLKLCNPALSNNRHFPQPGHATRGTDAPSAMLSDLAYHHVRTFVYQ